MSGYDAGQLYVRIVPQADGYGQEAAAEIRRQAPAVQAAAQEALRSTRPGGDTQIKALQQSAQTAGATLAALEAQAAKVSAEFLVGAASEAEATAALQKYALAGVSAAEANVKLALATGEAAAAGDIQILTQRRQIQQEKALEAQHAKTASTFRQSLRNVATGDAPASSLLGVGSIARFTAAGLAIGAVFTTVQRLQEGLKVTGEEAFTTEGKFRNLGSALLSGDVVGAFEALNAHAASASEQLEDLKANSNTTAGDLRAFGQESSTAATKLETLAAAQAKVGDDGAFADAIRESAAETRKAADDALALARAYETAASAAQDVSDKIRSAGSDAAAFGERARGPGDPGAQGRPGGGPSDVDNTATFANEDAIARSRAARTKGLEDDLAQAQREAARAAQLEKNQQSIAEGRAERHRATVEAQTRVDQIEQQIDANAAQAAKEAAAARERAAREAQSARDAAQRAYEQGVANDIKRLQIAADAAGNVGKAEAKYVAALRRESRDTRLSTQAQLQYAAELTNERQNQAQALKQAAEAETARKLALDDLRIQQADLTDGNADNERALNRKISDLKKLRSKTKQYSDEWIAYSSQITGLQITLKNLKDKESNTGFTLTELGAFAANQFNTFGSNISGRDGVLSGQDERAAFGGDLRRNLGDSPLLTESQRTNEILRAILAKIGRDTQQVGGSPALGDKGKQGNLLAIYGTEIAAAYGYGVN